MEIGNSYIFVCITWQRRCFSFNSSSSPAGVVSHTSFPWRATAAGNQRQNKEASLVVGGHPNSPSETHREFKVGMGKKQAQSGAGKPAGTRGDELTWWTCSCLYSHQWGNLGTAAPASGWKTWGAPALGKGDLVALLPSPSQDRDPPFQWAEGLEEKGHQAGSNREE